MVSLIVRDFGFRFRNYNPLIGILIFVEPIFIILTVAAMRIYLFGKVPPFGSSVVLFMGAGVFPFYIFRRCARGVRALKSRTAEYYFVKPFDFLLARFLIQQFQNIALMFLFFLTMWLYGIPEAAPWAPEKCALSLLAVSCLALGTALINSAIRSYFPGWAKIYAFLSRPLMMFSGAFKTVDLTPEPMRTIYAWNPLSHVIELFRWGIYPNYPVASLDGIYLAKWSVGTLVVGIILYNNREDA
ncbi:ABC transporter permease [Methylobacterium sp. 77]|uniref:ABC transporter permease n=1 Tax=Methylobacterium sp. 77 TaxID=1101192 RepID=UPI000374978B|nr:ABC transporter permease [Methylobacterium sp. 77]